MSYAYSPQVIAEGLRPSLGELLAAAGLIPGNEVWDLIRQYCPINLLSVDPGGANRRCATSAWRFRASYRLSDEGEAHDALRTSSL
jgi:hypothetical protein